MEQVWEDVTQRNDKYSMSPGWLVTNLSTEFGWEQPFNHAAILWLLSSEVKGGKEESATVYYIYDAIKWVADFETILYTLSDLN